MRGKYIFPTIYESCQISKTTFLFRSIVWQFDGLEPGESGAKRAGSTFATTKGATVDVLNKNYDLDKLTFWYVCSNKIHIQSFQLLKYFWADCENQRLKIDRRDKENCKHHNW